MDLTTCLSQILSNNVFPIESLNFFKEGVMQKHHAVPKLKHM